jgi:hypothetical protein
MHNTFSRHFDYHYRGLCLLEYSGTLYPECGNIETYGPTDLLYSRGNCLERKFYVRFVIPKLFCNPLWYSCLNCKSDKSHDWVRGIKITAVWDIALCSLVEVDWRFWGAYCFHHQGGRSTQPWNVGLLQWDCTTLFPRRLSSSYSPAREPDMSLGAGVFSCHLLWGLAGNSP